MHEVHNRPLGHTSIRLAEQVHNTALRHTSINLAETNLCTMLLPSQYSVQFVTPIRS